MGQVRQTVSVVVTRTVEPVVDRAPRRNQRRRPNRVRVVTVPRADATAAIRALRAGGTLI